MQYSFLLTEGQNHVYNQLYFINPKLALRQRLQRNSGLDKETLRLLDRKVRQVNPFVQIYCTATEIVQDYTREHPEAEAYLHPNLNLTVEAENDWCIYNLPQQPQIAALLPPELPAEQDTDQNRRYVLMRLRNRRSERIDPTVAKYMPTHYVLLFPQGDLGFSFGLHHVEKNMPTAR